MTTMTAHEALYRALSEEMQRDARVMLMGEGVATLHRDQIGKAHL